MLQDGSQALEAHACVHARRGQTSDAAVFSHVELHEHVVPNLDEAVAIFIRAAGRAAWDVVTVVVEDFRTRAARAGVGHHPEVVALVAATFVVANANHALGWQANFFGPNVIGFVVFLVDGGQQTLRGQLVDLGQQLPRPLERLTLEVVTKRPVAQHFKEGVVARGVAHVFQVVVFATGAQAGLHRGGTHVRALVFAQEHVFELDHARVGEHQGGVVARHQWARGHDGVAFGLEEVQKCFANIGDGELGCSHPRIISFGVTPESSLGLGQRYALHNYFGDRDGHEDCAPFFAQRPHSAQDRCLDQRPLGQRRQPF